MKNSCVVRHYIFGLAVIALLVNAAWIDTAHAGGEWISLGSLSYGNSFAASITDNGKVVVGGAAKYVGNGYFTLRAYRWTWEGGMVDLGILPGGYYSESFGVSADGNIIVGDADNSAGNDHAFRWTQATGMVDLGLLPGGSYSEAFSVSADGNIVVGEADDSTGNYRAFLWTQQTGMVDLGTFPGGTYADGFGISADGSVIVGDANDGAGHDRAFRWTQETGMVDLGLLPGGSYSVAYEVSASGNVVVGEADDSDGNWHAFRWTQAGGMVDLGVLPGGQWSSAYGVSGDGSVVVGTSYDNDMNQQAFRWTQATGMQTVSQWLVSNGVDASKVQFDGADSVSYDGRTIAGWRKYSPYEGHAFIARIEAIPTNIGVFSEGAWYLDLNGNYTWDGEPADNLMLDLIPNVTMNRAIPVVGNWDGMPVSRLGLYLDGKWYLDFNGNGMWDGGYFDMHVSNFISGLSNAVPVTGDWDGSGVTRIGVYSNGTWYLDMNGNGVWDGDVVDKFISNFGRDLPSAVPIVGNWDRAGITRIGIYSNGTWYLDMNGNGVWDGDGVDKLIPNFITGLPNAIPVAGDWDGTGVTRIGIYSNGTWYLDMNGNGIWDEPTCGHRSPRRYFAPSPDECNHREVKGTQADKLITNFLAGVPNARPVTGVWKYSGGVRFTLNVDTTGLGLAISNPSGINCGTQCSAVFDWGTSVDLTMTPTTRCYTFGRWHEQDCPEIGPCTIVMDSNRTLTAQFYQEYYGLDVLITGSGNVASNPAGISCRQDGGDCSGLYSVCSSVTLTATPDSGYIFTGWSGGGCSGTGACTIAMNASTTVTATFVSIVDFQITSPQDGAVINNDTVMVKGTISSTMGNVGITANSIPAYILNNEWTVMSVSLTDGANTITVTAKDDQNNVMTKTITVTKTTTIVKLIADTTSGVAPLTVSFGWTTNIPQETKPKYEIDFEGKGIIGYSSDNPTSLSYTYNTEGIYYPTLKVTTIDRANRVKIYTDSQSVVVLTKDHFDNMLKQKWEEMRTALMSRDVAAAANYFAQETKSLYSGLFTALYDNLTQIGQGMQGIQFVKAQGNTVKYRITRTELYGGQTVNMTYYIYFIIDRDGLWKIYRY